MRTLARFVPVPVAAAVVVVVVVATCLALPAPAAAQPRQSGPAWWSRLVAVPPRNAVTAEQRPAAPRDVAAPARPSTARVVAALEAIRRDARSSRYAHRTRVDERAGRYDFDCSGMVNWVLERTVPAARRAISAPRPVAADYAAVIARAPTDRARRGWQRVARLADARPGDVFAWRRPSWYPDRNTGHTGFVMDAPRPAPGLPPGYFLVRVADANPSGYDDDTRPEGTGGFGIGTVLVATDPVTGEATGMGGGANAAWIFPVRILIGRPDDGG